MLLTVRFIHVGPVASWTKVGGGGGWVGGGCCCVCGWVGGWVENRLCVRMRWSVFVAFLSSLCILVHVLPLSHLLGEGIQFGFRFGESECVV